MEAEEEELARSLRRSSSYYVHVAALVVGVLSFLGAIVAASAWRWGALGFVLSGITFCVSGYAALGAGRSLVTVRGGFIARSLLDEGDPATKSFERFNTLFIGMGLMVWGLALTAFTAFTLWAGM